MSKCEFCGDNKKDHFNGEGMCGKCTCPGFVPAEGEGKVSWQGFRRVVKPRKAWPCAWCKGIIQAGEPHQRYVGTYEGEFQDWRVHEDCVIPLEKSWDGCDGEICSSKHNRGSSWCYGEQDYHDKNESRRPPAKGKDEEA